MLTEKNLKILQIHNEHPEWTYQELGDLVGLTKQRIHQIVIMANNCDKINAMCDNGAEKKYKLDGESVSAFKFAKESGIPYSVIASWVERGHVKVVKHPGHGGRGNPVLLDPVTLQERLDKYRPRRKKSSLPDMFL